MFLRDVSERLEVLEKIVKIQPGDPFGQVEKWVSRGTIWGSVVELSADEKAYRESKQSDRNITETLYKITTRNTRRSWNYATTRFVWHSSDGDPSKDRTLKPKTDRLAPGRQGRRWVIMICEDITEYSSDKQPQ